MSSWNLSNDIVNTARIFQNKFLNQGIIGPFFLARVEVKAHRTDILPKKNPSRQKVMVNNSFSVNMKTVPGMEEMRL